jgi:hypothetical protein
MLFALILSLLLNGKLAQLFTKNSPPETAFPKPTSR